MRTIFKFFLVNSSNPQKIEPIGDQKPNQKNHILSYKGKDIKQLYSSKRYFKVAHMVKNLPAVQETSVQSLGQEDPLEEAIAIHSRIPVG